MAAHSDDAITAALRIISYRPRSESELGAKLAEKGYPTGEIKSAVEYLSKAGYVDDEKYASALAESRARNKLWGPAKIFADLKRRGLSKEAVAKAIEPLALEEEGTARAALDKWGRKNGARPPLKDKLYEKAARHLKARGFSTGVIIKAIQGYCNTENEQD